MEGGLFGFGTLDIAVHAFLVQSMLFGIMYIYINLPRPEVRQSVKQFFKKVTSSEDTSLDDKHLVAAGFRRDPVYYGDTTVDESVKLRFIRKRPRSAFSKRRCLNCHAHIH